MNPVNFELSSKQIEAYEVLKDDNGILELVFGGGARGGKTWLGCWFIISGCIEYPGSAWLIARETLKTLKRTTLRTFFKTCSALGYKKNIHFNYNASDSTITFVNGSVVFLAELSRQPSDPEYDRLGSYDLTGVWIDESQEVAKDAKDTLLARLTVLEGPGWSAPPKALFTCNPSKGWIYQDFWKPLVKEKKKIDGKMFITSLYSDNPYILRERYKKTVLQTKNKIKIERLLHGNFEYDDSPNRIFVYDKILDVFTNRAKHGQKYITSDIARTGDRIVHILWNGWQAERVFVFRNKTIPQTANFIKELAAKEQVPYSNIAIDADGMGVGVLDLVPNARGFHNGGRPYHPPEAEEDETRKLPYANLKTQCYIMLAEYVNAGLVGISDIDDEAKADLIEELDVQKQINVDTDKKVEIEKKEKIKELLGRSPDLSDAMMMRMFFEVAKEEAPSVRILGVH